MVSVEEMKAMQQEQQQQLEILMSQAMEKQSSINEQMMGKMIVAI